MYLIILFKSFNFILILSIIVYACIKFLIMTIQMNITTFYSFLFLVREEILFMLASWR